MADIDLNCNNAKCRKRLTNIAWITSCSHAFCDKDAEVSFLNNSQDDIVCPACKTSLPEKHDVVQADLKPTEKFKSMVLAGLRPDIIMDIANRALTFWQYQMYQELEYQKSFLKQCGNKISRIEENCENQITKLKNDLQKERRNNEVLQEDLKNKEHRITELHDQIVEKNQLVQNLMAVNIKLRCNTNKTQPANTDCEMYPRKKYNIGPQALADINPQAGLLNETEFDFRPVSPLKPEGAKMPFQY
ncbi:hypothetical protein L9F63_003697 [Diploptera punctata]|uniref:RING-type domain-containing protein n=1 Tax=Diploptera punctata TaxID=6984 RepID=A0AAD7ZJN7_DIPPU|nr:hypothetical protein L9F63_003697 [Diploptera punctata]